MLNISIPQTEYKKQSEMPTETMTAAYNMKSDTLILTSDNFTKELALAIAHELRHKWQMIHCKTLLENYKESALTDLTSYNLQSAEVDAHAFSSLVMGLLFGVKPLFNNMDQSVKDAIQMRQEEIKTDVIEQIKTLD